MQTKTANRMATPSCQPSCLSFSSPATRLSPAATIRISSVVSCAASQMKASSVRAGFSGNVLAPNRSRRASMSAGDTPTDASTPTSFSTAPVPPSSSSACLSRVKQMLESCSSVIAAGRLLESSEVRERVISFDLAVRFSRTEAAF